MKKTKKTNRNKIGMLLVLLMLVIAGCSSGTPAADMSAYEGFPEDHKFLAIKPKEFMKNVEEKVKGIYLVATPDSLTSYNFVEILDEISREKDLDIYYLDLNATPLNEQQTEKLGSIALDSTKSESYIGIHPSVYIVDKDYVDVIAPVFEGLSVSGRTLTSEETMLIKTDINRLIYE